MTQAANLGALGTNVSSSGIAQAAGGGTAGTNGAIGFKNRLINGDMQIWQRGTSLTGTGAASAQYIADRWGSGSLNSSYVVSRSTDVPTGAGFQYSLKIQRTAGQTSTAQANIIQAIESVNMLDLAGKNVTFSFWAKCGANFSMASSALGVIVTTGTVADQGVYASQGGWTGQAYPVNTAQVITTSWQKFTFTGTFGSTALEAAAYFYMVGAGTAGADDSFFITGVQLEAGSTATNFDVRSIGTELNLCQRYYEFGGIGNAVQFSGDVTSANNYFATIYLSVPKRVAPTIVNTSVTASSFPATASTASDQSASAFRNYRTSNATGNGAIFGDSWTASAEL
jgi:hypothetical protein